MGFWSKWWPGFGRDVWVNGVIASALFPRPLRWRALRGYGMAVGPSTISPGTWFGGKFVSIGHATFVNYGCMFDSSARITIGERCDIAMRVTFVTSSHETGEARRRAGASRPAPITVGDGCWIGAGAVILPGTVIGDGVIIAAGAVVRGECEPHSIYAGVPARKISELAH